MDASSFHVLRWAVACGAAAIGGMAAPAMGQDAQESGAPFDIEATIDVVSDYRFRGISLSDRDPALQPSITVTHESGFYVGAWGSNVADNGGADIEIDALVGYGFSAGGFDFDLGGTYYVYPGAGSANYGEIIGSVERPIGSGSIGFTAAYTPAQSATGDLDNIYLALNGSAPVFGPVSAKASFGWETGVFGDDKLDWLAGVDVDLGRGFTAGAAYVDSYRSFAGPNGSAGAVFSIGKAF